MFADVLAQHLGELNVVAEVVNWTDCPNLECLRVPDASSTATIVVFAGTTYNAALPSDLTSLIPVLAAMAPQPMVTSALTSCGVGPGVDAFVSELSTAGVTTIQGVSLQTDATLGGAVVTEAEMHQDLTAFAHSLVGAI